MLWEGKVRKKWLNSIAYFCIVNKYSYCYKTFAQYQSATKFAQQKKKVENFMFMATEKGTGGEKSRERVKSRARVK